MKLGYGPQGLEIRRHDHSGNPYTARRPLLYCAGCGQWHPYDGETDPLQCGFGLCRGCWLGDSDRAFDRAHRGAWDYILQTFAGPWTAPTPK